MSKYLLFVDDSGNREYADDQKYERVGGKSRYFVYGGVLIEQRAASLFVPTLHQLKSLTFGRAGVEIKCNWLRLPKERHAHYLEPYGINDEGLTKFTDDYYRLINEAPLTFIASVVDKLHMQQTYGPNAWYAPTLAYDTLLQRAVQAVAPDDSIAVTVDDIGGKTPKQNAYTQLLARHHESLVQHGSRLLKSLSFASLTGPVRFVNSKHSDLVQVADLAAYNVHRQFRDFGTEWEQSGGPGAALPMYPYFERISGKFRKDENGRVQGFGIVKVPLRNRVRWTIVKKNE
jgi:uncharacterized protein DUF3800